MEQRSPAPVIRDLPWLPWGFGLTLGGFALPVTVVALATFWSTPEPDVSFKFLPLLLACLFGLGSLVVFLLASVLTIHAERARGFLTLSYRSPLRKTVKEIPLHQIASIDIEVFQGAKGPTYRVVITESDGQVTPLRYPSSGEKNELAKQLRELTGVSGSMIHGNAKN
jgi:hypothetical protein